MLQWWRAYKAKRKEQRRLQKFARAQAWSDGLGLQDTFERIYTENKWGAAEDGAQFCSGNGSKPGVSAEYEDFLVGFLSEHPEISSIVDIGCGDFQVSNRILSRLDRDIDYTGCDIVAPLIAAHQATHGTENRRFLHLNAVEQDPPATDLVTIRQILQHLSNDQAVAVLERAKRLYRCAIITESLPVPLKQPNLDIAHGIATRIALGSGIYIEEPPFSLTASEHFEVGHGPNEVMRTSLVWFDNP